MNYRSTASKTNFDRHEGDDGGEGREGEEKVGLLKQCKHYNINGPKVPWTFFMYTSGAMLSSFFVKML